MHITPAILLIVAVFTAQILVLSIIVPRWFQNAFDNMRRRFPPETHPRLWPFPVDRIQRVNTRATRLRAVIVLAAFSILIGALIGHVEAPQFASLMLLCALLQALPAVLLLPSQLRLARAYRAMPAPALRSAELTPLRLTQFVPPLLILLGVVATAAGTVTAALLYISQPDHPLRDTLFACVCAPLLLRMLYVLLRPLVLSRPDPYMADGDVFRARRRRLRTLFILGAVVGTSYTLMGMELLGAMNIDVVYIRIGGSIVLQLWYVYIARTALQSFAARDTSVYRANFT